MDWRMHITSDPNICHGKMCFRGTRVLVSVILDRLDAEMTHEEILRDYPSLTEESFEAALAYSSARKARVIETIRHAFAETPSPGPDFEDISATFRDEGIVDYFRGTTWEGHPTANLRFHSCALSFFTDNAFRYWIPAFVLAELQEPLESDTIGESIAFHLSKSRIADDRLRVFSLVELHALAEFMDFEASQSSYLEIFTAAGRRIREEIASRA